MKLHYSSMKAILLGAALLLLSGKGGQELVIDENFSLIVNLPTWLLTLKSMIVPIAVMLIAGYLFLAVMARKKLAHAPLLSGYVVVLAYYFLRSAWLGSNVQSNLLAFVILLAFTLATSLELGANFARDRESPSWMTALSYFCHGYVVVTSALLVTGYGYAQVSERFFGMTYHPNTEGAFASLCSGLFATELRRPGTGRRQRLVESLFMAMAVLLVIASGSRSAVLMTLAALVCLAPTRYAVIAVVGSIFAFYLVPGIGISESNSTIGGAIARMLHATVENRNEVWGHLLSDFASHPFLGVGDTSNVSGSGLLTGFAGNGVLGGLLFLLVFAAAAKRCLGLIIGFRRGRMWSPTLVAAVLILQLLIGAVFEATLFDKFSPFPLLAMIFLMAISLKPSNRNLLAAKQLP